MFSIIWLKKKKRMGTAFSFFSVIYSWSFASKSYNQNYKVIVKRWRKRWKRKEKKEEEEEEEGGEEEEEEEKEEKEEKRGTKNKYCGGI